MTSIFLDQSAALDKHLSIMPLLPPVAWEGIVFEPENGTAYLKTENAQLKTVPETERDNTSGNYKIDIYTPSGTGKNEAVSLADTIANWFKTGMRITYNGVTVVVKNARISGGNNPVVGINSVSGSGWYNLTLTINYFSFTQRR